MSTSHARDREHSTHAVVERVRPERRLRVGSLNSVSRRRVREGAGVPRLSTTERAHAIFGCEGVPAPQASPRLSTTHDAAVTP
jgi:hypothetical protein